MSSFNEVYERIKFATNTRTQVELADVLEIRQSSISDAKRRNSVPADWLVKLFDKFGLSPDWLKQGMGPMYLRTEQGYEPQYAPADGVVAETFAHYADPEAKSVLSTVYGMACEASPEGPDAPLPLRPVGKVSLPLSHAGPRVTVFRMESPNMEPVILRNAFFGVDTSCTNPVSGTLFALRMAHEGVVVKRLFLDSNEGHFILRSEAPGYPEVTLKPEALARRILGRVCWVLQQL